MKYVLLYILLVIIVVTSSIYKFGWIHLLASPLILAHIVLIGITLFSKYGRKQKALVKIPILISAILFYLFLVDGGDTGGLYCFYGIIKGEILATNFGYVFIAINNILLAFNIYFMINIAIMNINAKKNAAGKIDPMKTDEEQKCSG